MKENISRLNPTYHPVILDVNGKKYYEIYEKVVKIKKKEYLFNDENLTLLTC